MSARCAGRSFGALLLMFALACSRKPATPKRTVAPSIEPGYELRIGKEIYGHYCQTCHGETGAGDGFNAFNLDPRPRDLSAPAFQKKKTDAELADAVRRGGAGVGLAAVMPPWGHTLSSRQIDQVVLYLRYLRAPERPAEARPAR